LSFNDENPSLVTKLNSNREVVPRHNTEDTADKNLPAFSIAES